MQDLMKNSEALNLCEHLLTLDPKKRYSASDALESDFFRNYSKDAGVLNLKTVCVQSSHNEKRFAVDEHD
jgi:serine/threonine protein kinase